MEQRGFSLIELVVVVAVISILAAIVTLQFNQYTLKHNIEKQIRTMYADLMNARSEALLQKKNRSVSVTGAQFAIYSSIDGTGTPLKTTILTYPVTYDNATIFSFNSCGVGCDTTGTPGIEKTVCVTPEGNPAAVDSILITTTGILMGKWKGNCDSAHFTAK